MSKKLNLSGKLDFTDIDLTAPEVVINELLEELPAETNGLICGKIQSYSGHVMSYKTRGILQKVYLEQVENIFILVIPEMNLKNWL